jgi:hypothetical protein
MGLKDLRKALMWSERSLKDKKIGTEDQGRGLYNGIMTYKCCTMPGKGSKGPYEGIGR